MASAILGVKYAIETAALVTGQDWPDLSAIVKTFERLAYPAPGDWIMMAPNHNAVRGAITGLTATVQGYSFKLIRPYRYHAPANINPLPGMTSTQWYNSW
ncbi:MAG: hypothetical protein ABWJ97_04255 [Thermoproteus sp.]